MNKQNKFLSFIQSKILIFFLVIVSIITSFSLSVNGAYANSSYPYDSSPVLQDLQSAKEFNVNNYPASQDKDPAILNFVEWCYSEDSKDFALYVYFYNPRQWNISEQDEGNLATMAVAYNSNDSPSDYESFKLIVCNSSEDKLFYKFRIEDHESKDRNTIQTRVNPDLRRYDMSALTFGLVGGGAKTFAVGGCFKFSGYAKGYGSDDVSTLKSEGVTYQETLRLFVNPTVYRTASSEFGGNHQVDVNSVYFSVPEKYFTEYGNLQKIKAEWYEYKLKPMMTFENQSAYDEVEPYLGQNIGYHADGLTTAYYEDEVRIPLGPAAHISRYNGFTYNVFEDRLGDSSIPINTLYLGFVSEDGHVPRETVESAVKGYNKTYNKGSLNLGGTKYSLDIFEDSVDEGRTMGYNLKEIDAGETFNLLNYYDANDDTSGLKRFWADLWGLHDYTDRKDVSPIESNISNTMMSLDKEELSRELLINEDDVEDFKKFYDTAKKNGERTVLFRFAQTDYFNSQLDCYTCSNCAWISYESIFLDFRIIQLTFSKAGTYTVIPVAQDPIDIINGLTPHPDDEPLVWVDEDGPEWWWRLVVIFMLLCIIACCAGVLILVLLLIKYISDIKSKGWRIFWYIVLAVFFIGLLLALHYGGAWAVGIINKYGGLK